MIRATDSAVDVKITNDVSVRVILRWEVPILFLLPQTLDRTTTVSLHALDLGQAAWVRLCCRGNGDNVDSSRCDSSILESHFRDLPLICDGTTSRSGKPWYGSSLFFKEFHWEKRGSKETAHRRPFMAQDSIM